MVRGSCLLLRSSTASQCKSSSTLVLLTAFSMKLCSSAVFLILRPQGLQTRSDKFSFLINGNPIEPQQWAKISPAPSTLPDGKNKFSSEALPPTEVKLTPQNLQLLFVFLNVYFGFPSPLTNFCRSRDADVLLSFSLQLRNRLWRYIPAWSQSSRKARDWFWLVVEIRGEMQKTRLLKQAFPFFSFLPFPPH